MKYSLYFLVQLRFHTPKMHIRGWLLSFYFINKPSRIEKIQLLVDKVGNIARICNYKGSVIEVWYKVSKYTSEIELLSFIITFLILIPCTSVYNRQYISIHYIRENSTYVIQNCNSQLYLILFYMINIIYINVIGDRLTNYF